MKLIAGFLALVCIPITSALAETFEKVPEHYTSEIQAENLNDGGLGISPSEARPLPPLALDLIKDFEQWRAEPYNDAANFCTIGYGHLVSKKPCEESAQELDRFDVPLPLKIGNDMLDRDTALARVAVQTYVRVQLTDEQFGALTSFVFNVGAGAFSRSTLLKYVNNEEWEGVPSQFRRWIIAGGKVSNGLIVRRACEAALFAGTLEYRSNGRFYRDDCDALGAAGGTEAPIDILVGETP